MQRPIVGMQSIGILGEVVHRNDPSIERLKVIHRDHEVAKLTLHAGVTLRHRAIIRLGVFILRVGVESGKDEDETDEDDGKHS